MKKELSILLVEDNEGDVRIIKEMLKEQSFMVFNITLAGTLNEAIKKLSAYTFDTILLDLGLPDSVGFETFRKLNELYPKINAIIILTGLNDTEVGLKAVNQGAQDYIIKGQIDSDKLLKSIIYSNERNRLNLELKLQLEATRVAEGELLNSELKLQKAQAISHVGSWELNLSTKSIWCSEEALRIYGFDIKSRVISLELVQKSPLPEYRPILDEVLDRLLKYNEPYLVEFRINHAKDGTIRSIYAKAEIAPPSDDNQVKVIGVIQDITDQKQAEEALRKSEEKYRRIFENVQDVYYEASIDGTILDVSPSIGIVSKGQYHRDDLIGKSIYDFYNDPLERQTLLIVLKERGSVPDFEIILKNRDGSCIPCSISSKICFDDQGRPEKIIGSMHDITDRKQAEKELLNRHDHLEELVNERTEELRKAKKEAEDANKAKSEFLANMSHEIRTPMNAVLGYTELLSNTLVDQTQKDYANSIKSSGRSLLTLINDILDLSKIEAGKLEMEYDYVDTYSFFSEFERIFSLKVSEKGLKFILDITSGTPQGIYIDEARMRQIVFNLIGNAIKFTSEGKIVLKVFTENPQILNYSKGKSEELIDLIIEVKDTGIGISKELQEMIFEPFVQERDHKKYGGTGLGLTITRRLTSLMNGSINLQTELDKGSTFTVRIPEISYLRDFSKTSIDINIDPAEIIFEEAVILITDDVEHNRCYLRDALKNTSLKIVEAEDGIAAFKLAKKIIPDLIIADIRMPKMDGFQFLNKIKTNKKLKQIPVIAYSASVLRDQKERINSSEFAGLLIKPVKVTELYLELMNFLPFKSNREAESDKPHSEVDLIGEITNLPGLIHSLKTHFYTTWKTFSVTQSIKGIREFGKNLSQLGLDHNSVIITGYGKDLISAADSFNIEAILKLIGKYKIIIESLKDSTKNICND